MILMPSVIEKVGNSTKQFDLPSKLLNDRIVYLQGDITEDSANNVVMQLLWLNSDSQEDIHLYINSNGGEVYQGLAIKDMIDRLDCKVHTTGIGMCASMGAYLLFSGTGDRRATKNCRIMIHSVSSGVCGVIHDMEVSVKESKYVHNNLLQDISIFSKGNLSIDLLHEMTQRDYYMNATEAKEHGLIDLVL